MDIMDRIGKFIKISIHEDAGPGWINALRLNGISIQKNPERVLETFWLSVGTLVEVKEASLDYKGGVIIFSPDAYINKNKEFIGNLKSWLKNNFQSLIYAYKKDTKLHKTTNRHKQFFRFAVGNFFNGRYATKNGKPFDEKSLSLEIIGIEPAMLKGIATEIAREFDHETILVKDYHTNEMYLVISIR